MGQIKQENNEKWSIRYDIGNKNGKRNQRKESGFKTKEEAKKTLTIREGEVASEKISYDANMKFNDFVDFWLNTHVIPKRAYKTVEFYTNLTTKYIKPHFQKFKLGNVKTIHIEEFYNKLKKETNLSDTTIHHIHKTLRACLNYAVNRDFLIRSPVNSEVTPAFRGKPLNYWTPDEIKKALLLFKGTPIEWHVSTALYSGLRIGEVCGLELNSLDFINETLQIVETRQFQKKKGHILKIVKTPSSASTIPLSRTLCIVMKERVKDIETNKIQNALFYEAKYINSLSVRRDGSLLSTKYVSNYFHQTLIKQSEIPVIRFHDLRHSCAAWLISNGVDLKHIQVILRHSTFSTTADIYGHVSMASEKKALNTLKI